ncbi:hypothetical protein H5972_05580 [Ligilactobacillus salivarius]|uniref:hypothetical protein n=1 Tax=Ligilactobacillus salivarius TaxID=1624 RepID=UPI001956EA88|nr:hypothetical protein [Ligilactobacillus salivarius]MBM6956734.1 hypothetical protein [Ligilactobacillus salivarius]
MNLENGDNIEKWFDEFVKPQSEVQKNEQIGYKVVTVYLASGREMVVNYVSSVSEYNNERGGLALELYGKGKTGKNKKMVFNLTSDNIVGYSIDDEL